VADGAVRVVSEPLEAAAGQGAAGT
jgi:hypothetical protein